MMRAWTSPSSKNEDKDAWLLKIELKREEPEQINKDEGIKKAMEVQVPAVKEEDIPQPLPNLFAPTKIEAFKMIELAHIQNKYLTQENILLKDHIADSRALSASWRSFYARCAIIHHHHHHLHLLRGHNHMGMGTPLGNCQAWGRCPGIVSQSQLLSLPFFLSSVLLVVS